MADKIEYSRLLMKRSTQSGEVPTVPPITATTLNQFTPTDVFVGEFFLNAVDDLLWIRTDNGILPIDLSGSTGTTVPSLNQVLFQGNETQGLDILVTSGDTIVFGGLVTGSTTQFLGLDVSGNTIVSGVAPGTPDLQSVLFQGNQTNGTDIEVSSGDTIQFLGLNSGSTTDLLGVDASGNTIVTTVSTPAGLYLPLSGGTVTGNTYFGATSGITMDQVNNRLGINTATPQFTIEAFGTQSRVSYEDTVGGVLQISGGTSLPRFQVTAAPSTPKPLFSLNLGVRTWDDVTYPGYGKVGDGHLYASNEANGLNLINRQGTGTTEDYIRFYAGQDANGTTADMHIQGSGATRGYIGMGTETPVEKLDVVGNVKMSGDLTIGTIGGTTPVINLGLDANGLVVTGTTGGGTSVFKSGNGANSIVADYLATTYAPNQFMLVAGSHSGATIPTGDYSVVWGGLNNTTNQNLSFVGGGQGNTGGFRSVVLGGLNNTARGNGSVVLGGETNSAANNTAGGIFVGTNNTIIGPNETALTIIGGTSNRIQNNGGIGSTIIGGRSNRWANAGSTIGSETRNGTGAMVGGSFNRIEGNTTDSLGAHAFPLILGGTLSKIFGQQSDNTETTGATIINSISSTIKDSLLSAHFETSGSTISGRTQAVMIGTNGRTADADNTTYTENLKTFGNLTIGSVGGTTPLINLGLDANGLVVTGTTGGGDTLWTSGSTASSITSVAGANNNTASNSLAAGNNLTVSSGSTYSAVFGNLNYVNGIGNVVGGVGHPYINADDCAVFGRVNYVESTGKGSGAFGWNNEIRGEFSLVSGRQNIIETGSTKSSIIGGEWNLLEAERSAIIGGSYITGTTDDMLYVPNLTIVSATTGTSIASLGIDSTGKVIKTNGGVGLFLPLSGGTVTGDTTFTQDLFLTNLTSGGSQTLLTVDSDTGQVYTATNFLNPYTGAVGIVGDVSITGQTHNPLPTTATTTSIQTINFSNGNIQKWVLGVATTSLILANMKSGGRYTLIFQQSASGGGTIGWPAQVRWPGGVTPTMTSTANRYDVYNFVFDGINLWASYEQNYTGI